MSRGRERGFRVAAAAAAMAVFVGLAAAQVEVWEGEARISDTPRYRELGEQMAAGEVPYRDFRVEYPPVALTAFVVPSLASDDELGYDRVFALAMIALGVATIGFVAWALAALGAGRPRFVLALAVPATAPLLLGPLVLTRFDLLPAAIAAAALTAALLGRGRLASGALGLGIAAKLYPGALLPLVVADVARRRGRRDAAVAGVVGVAVAAVVLLAFFVVAPEGVARSVWRQLERPLQIESLGSGVLLALHHLAGLPLSWESSHGSQNLTGGVAVAAALVLAPLQVALVVWLWVRYVRGPADPERLVCHAAAVLVALVALGRVLSPQFLVWLLPVVPLVRGRRGAAAGALLVGACLLTRSWFPGDYWALVREFDGRASALVLARDLCLVALLAVLAWPEARRSAAGEER